MAPSNMQRLKAALSAKKEASVLHDDSPLATRARGPRRSALIAHRLLAGPCALAATAAFAQAASGTDGTTQQPAAEVTLPLVSVTASQGATGDTGYRARSAASATKTDTPLHETPQSITVVTRERIEDSGAQTLQDALNYAAGVHSQAFGLDTKNDWLRVRGAAPDQYLDGLRQSFGFYTATRSDPYTLERLEVLRGPAAMLYGQGSTGGLVNLVSKRPQQEAQREIGVQLGSFRRRQVQMDLTGPLGDAPTWSYRLVALARDSGTQVDHVPDDRWLVAPSLTWRPSAATSLTLQALRQQDHTGSTIQFLPWSGTLAPNPNGRIPTDRFLGEPGFDRYDADRGSVGWLFEHRLDAEWTVRQTLRASSNDVGYRQVAPYVFGAPAAPFTDAAGRTLDRFAQFTDVRARMLVTDQHLEGRVDIGGMQHRLLVGLDALRSRQADATVYDFPQSLGGAVTPIDAYNPVYGTYTPAIAPASPDRTTLRQVGVYLQDQVKFGEHWIAVAGVRHDRARNDREGAEAERSHATTQRLGFMYAAERGWSPYLSYSESFTPVPGTNAAGMRFTPMRGRQLEAGVKFAPTNGAYSVNAAVYELREANRLITDPANATNFLQAGRTKTRGLEIEWLGRVNRTLDLSAHYNYLRNDPQLDTLPRHQAALWAKQRLQVAGVSGLSLSLGMRHLSAMRDGDAPTTPRVTLVDAGLGWEGERWDYALHATNLTDRTYVSACLARGDCFYGARRTLLLSATHRF